MALPLQLFGTVDTPQGIADAMWCMDIDSTDQAMLHWWRKETVPQAALVRLHKRNGVMASLSLSYLLFIGQTIKADYIYLDLLTLSGNTSKNFVSCFERTINPSKESGLIRWAKVGVLNFWHLMFPLMWCRMSVPIGVNLRNGRPLREMKAMPQYFAVMAATAFVLKQLCTEPKDIAWKGIALRR